MRVSVVCVIEDGDGMCCVMIILNWREMCASVVCVVDGEECCVMIILNWRQMRVSVVCVIDNVEEMLCDDNS